MNVLKFFLIIFSALSYGQDVANTIKVNYSEITDFGILAETNSTLKVNNFKSVYTRESLNYNNIDKEVTEKKYSDTLIEKKQVLEVFYSNWTEKTIFLKDNSLKSNILVQDSIINIYWDIDTSSTNEPLLGYKCNKATGRFRGRNYTVWFTTEIPVKFGPWKLHGLPGLVLKVKDNLNQIHIQATEIVISKAEKIENIAMDDFEEIITVKDHLLLKKENEGEFLNEVMSRVQSTMPRGSVIKNVKKENSNKNRFEIIYEWEETENKQD